MARSPERYVAVIADMVRSRDISHGERRELQNEFSALVASLNRVYRTGIASRFIITLGDEFQGLLTSATVIPDLLWRLEQDFPARDLRVGLGMGILDTPLQKYAINIDGPVLHLARAAIEESKRSDALGGVFRGFEDLDEILNGMARLLWFHRSSWTPSQLRIAGLLRQGMTQTEAAKKLGITKQVVSKQVLAAGCVPYIAAEKSWRKIFEKYIDPLISSRHVSAQAH